jgi:hypothetical protein
MFARVAGLPVPFMIPVPVLTPRLSSLLIHLVTPVPAAIARPLAEGLSLPTTCTENSITKIIPQELISCSEAIRRALDRVRQEQVDTCWADAGQIKYPEWSHFGDSDYSGGTILSCGYQATVKGNPQDLWKSVVTIGGETGYYGADFLWRIRGVIDIFTGGVGLSRGRRSKNELRVGDALDFWRVLDVEFPSKLLLIAEMKTPGEALLEIRIEPLGNDQCDITLLARFLPRGLLGILYWYVLYPSHQYVFTRMLRGLVNASGLKLITPPKLFKPEQRKTCRLPDE